MLTVGALGQIHSLEYPVMKLMLRALAESLKEVRGCTWVSRLSYIIASLGHY